MNKNPLNILLCAYACEPNKGSEPEVGWGTATTIAKKTPTNNYFVITRKNNRKSIEKQDTPKNLKFIYFELTPWILKIKKLGNFTRIYYYLWMLGAVRFIKKGKYNFDIIHHITFVNDWLPSIFIKLKTKENKFIWGSIGSHSKVPNKFLYSNKDKFIELNRMLLQRAFRAIDPNFKKCVVKSDLIIGINTQVSKKLNCFGENYITIPAIAQTPSNKKCERPSNDESFKVLSVGRLIHIKNFRLTLRVFSRFFHSLDDEDKRKTELTIIGTGNQKDGLVKLAMKLDIFDNINFIDYIPQKELMSLYLNSDIFLFPTTESAGFVILEAMSKQLPVIALDYGGPEQFIRQNKQHQLVDINMSIQEIEVKMSSLLNNLFKNKNLRIETGNLNKQTVFEEFTWDKKADKYIEIYKKLFK